MTDSKTILLVIEGTYPWYRGGVSEWVHQYIRAFPDYAFHLLQVATDPFLHSDFSKALYKMPPQVTRFERIPPPDLSRDWRQESLSWFESVRPAASPLCVAADLIHVANTGFAGWLGQQLAALNDLPLVLTEHALYWKEVSMGAVALECGYQIPDTEYEKERVSGWFQQMAGDIYRAADMVISVSRCNMPEQVQRGAEEVVYIPNGVPESWLKSDAAQGQELCIGWVGRCAEMKNPLRFFNLVEALRDQNEFPVRFLMLLSDANEPELAKRVKEKAAAFPEVQTVWNEPARDWYGKMDALCISSHNESQPLVLFEALAARVLPVGWQAGDVTPAYGVIATQETPAHLLAREVIDLWRTRKRWREKVNRLHEQVRQFHVWPGIFGRYRRLFERLPERQAGRV